MMKQGSQAIAAAWALTPLEKEAAEARLIEAPPSLPGQLGQGQEKPWPPSRESWAPQAITAAQVRTFLNKSRVVGIVL